jgi:hypothetical protein
MPMLMTKTEAQALAKWAPDYYAKKIKGPRHVWGVWCATSDHWVEFDQADIDKAAPVQK